MCMWPQHPLLHVVALTPYVSSPLPSLKATTVAKLCKHRQINLTTLDLVDSLWNSSKYTVTQCHWKAYATPALWSKTLSKIIMLSMMSAPEAKAYRHPDDWIHKVLDWTIHAVWMLLQTSHWQRAQFGSSCQRLIKFLWLTLSIWPLTVQFVSHWNCSKSQNVAFHSSGLHCLSGLA